VIILDTNALIYSIKQRIDLKKFVNEEIAVPVSAIRELEALSDTDSNAKLALKLIDKYRILDVSSNGDRGILEAATRYGGIVLTNDRKLKKDLKERNIRVTSISNRIVRKL
jgi:rRNA-processing protein FCF1